jgi:hypothetical protein
MGAGPMTGGGWGYCNPANKGVERPSAWAGGSGRGMAYGRGFRGGGYGFGRSMRRGFGRGIAFYPPAYSPAGYDYPDDLNLLKQEAVTLKNRLESINKRISNLEQTD